MCVCVCVCLIVGARMLGPCWARVLLPAPGAAWLSKGSGREGREALAGRPPRFPPAPPPPCHPPAPPSSERDRLYERAERVGALLSHLGEQLKEAIADVNESTCEHSWAPCLPGLAWLRPPGC